MSQVGRMNMRNYEISQHIQARVAEAQVTPNEVIGTLASQMRADITHILTKDGISTSRRSEQRISAT